MMTFAYHKSLGPIMGVLLALGLAEMLVVHLVAAAYWGLKVALPIGLVDASVVVLLVRLLVSFRRLPVILDGSRLTLRAGHKLGLTVSAADIAGFREHWSREDLKTSGVLNMALVAWPNIVIDLRRASRRGRKEVRAIAHKLDDPIAFRAAVERAMKNTGSDQQLG